MSRERLYGAALWFLLGTFAGSAWHHPAPAPQPQTTPAPAPSPVPQPQPAPQPHPRHAGHLFLSYIEPRYPTPASAALRDSLAAVDWHSLDATFRSYTDGQPELTALGFTKLYQPAELPILYIQEAQGTKAPVIDTAKAPASAQGVLDRLKELRGP